MTSPQRIDYVALSRALAGHSDPAELDEQTAVAYAEHVAARTDEPTPPPSQAEADAEAFFAACREAEAAIGDYLNEVGPGEEFEAFIADMAALRDAAS